MLHDLGKLILAWKLSGHFERMLAESVATHSPVNKIEEAVSGFSHAEIGAYLLGLWGLPYTVVEAVALHHRPNRVPRQSFDAISAVYVANLLAHELEESSNAESAVYNLENYQEELASLGILEKIPEWRAIAAAMPALVAEA
jgi:HD-like signal output (HDOD) protein